jgi:hypothetical protein
MRGSSVVRYLLNGLGVIDVLMFLAGIHSSGMLIALGVFAMVLGITNFGLQCPLILSARYITYQLRPRVRLPVLSAKPIDEARKADRK